MSSERAGYITQSGNTPLAEAMGQRLQMAPWGSSLRADGKWLFLAVLFLPIGHAGRLQSSIIGGEEAEPHSRPYMVSVQFGDLHRCGGALIHVRWVLTAAHCYPPSELPIWVVAGLQQQPRDNGTEQRFSVVKSVLHPSYDRTTMANDIMLLKLDRKVLWKKKTPLIKLATKAPAPGTWCSVAGWGVSEQGGKPSPVLRELDVRVMDARMCNNSRYWRGEITKTMVCIEGVETDSAPCKGDSGGPVVCGKKAKVAGVLSFGPKLCVDIFKPPVATAVYKYRMWIRKVLFWP